MLTAPAARPLAATRSLVTARLDAPRTRGRLAEPRRGAARPGSLPGGTPPLLAPRVRRLASVSAASPGSPPPGRSTKHGPRRDAQGLRDRRLPAAHRPAAEDRRPPPPEQGSGGEGRVRRRGDRLRRERLQEEARPVRPHAGGRGAD